MLMVIKAKENIKWLLDNHCILIIGILYTITAFVVVGSAWIENIYHFDLNLTISIYVALRPWTAVLYGIVAIIMTAMGIRYINNCVTHKGKRFVYYIVFICILGCAVCPCNSEWSMVMFKLHNLFAIGLMLMVLISFGLGLMEARFSVQRIASIVSICYAIFFIVSYLVLRLKFFTMTLFIWENAFIYLLLTNLYFEMLNFKIDT